MKLSIVTTLYQSSDYLVEFCQRMSTAAQELVGDSYEILLVNDGSPDKSLEIAIETSRQNPHVVVVDLSRNFGHHKAIMTGLRQATGERVFLIDCDLEEEPEWLMPFDLQMNQEQCDVVYGVQIKRKGGWFERWTGGLFWKLINLLSGLSLPENVVTARLMVRSYVEALVQHEEREVFLAGLWHITGFRQLAHPVTKLSRGETTYTLSKKASLLVSSITSFSNRPLIAVFQLGVLISVASAFYVIYLVTNWLFFSKPLTGWTSIIASVWLLGGLITSSLGIIGIYISKIFLETKQRPYSIIRGVYRSGTSS